MLEIQLYEALPLKIYCFLLILQKYRNIRLKRRRVNQ